MKRLISLAAAAASLVAMYAAGDGARYRSMAVRMTGGETVTLGLRADLRVGVSADSLVVSTSSYRVAWPLDGVEGWSHDTAPAGDPGAAIGFIAADSGADVTVGRDAMTVSGLPAGQRVTLYDMSGAAVRSAVASDEGTAVVTLDDLGRGVYVAAWAGRSVRIVAGR